jgi:N-acetyl-beta-hexosaminidase
MCDPIACLSGVHLFTSAAVNHAATLKVPQIQDDPAGKSAALVSQVLEEMSTLFPDAVLHIGGDETGATPPCTVFGFEQASPLEDAIGPTTFLGLKRLKRCHACDPMVRLSGVHSLTGCHCKIPQH